MMNRINRRAGQILMFPLLFAAGPSYAQVGTETGSLVSTMAFSVGSLVVLVLGWIILRRVSGRNRDTLGGAAGLDLMDLRKKNLLTPEELAMVSTALARRMAEKDLAIQKLATAPTPNALLNDPEVRRLEALAMAAKAADEKARAAARTAAEQVVSREPIEHAPEDQPAETQESLDDVILPPDVQQLADAGILTPEEIDNVKRRLRAARDHGGSSE